MPFRPHPTASSKHGDAEAVVTNAVTGGHLPVSDALPVIKKVEGRPVFITLKTDKTCRPRTSTITV